MIELTPELVARIQSLVNAAAAAGEPEPTSMALATRNADGGTSVRIVLLKGVDARGLRFFTNYESRKGHQLDAWPEVALSMHFKHLEHGVQIRVEGRAEKLPAAESDAYFATRPRGSQIGAWASQQSRELADRSELEARVARFEVEYAGREVPRPPHWGGFVVRPHLIEFWHAQPSRLHERESFAVHDGQWQAALLYP